MARITINGITTDPLASSLMTFAPASAMSADAADSNFILVQTTQPLNRAQREELENYGATILEYVPENTYLCSFEPTDLGPIRALTYVTWANVYMRGFKIAPALQNSLPNRPGERDIVEISSLPVPTLSTTPKTVDIVFHKSVDPETVREKIAGAARLNPAELDLTPEKVRLTVQEKYLQDLAAIDEVRNIEKVFPNKLSNDVARRILRLEANPAGAPVPFEGEGQIIAVADTGFDQGSSTNTHPAFTGRVAKLYALGRPGNANDPNGHGTHVAGSVLGDGQSAVLGVRIRGTAPRARLVLQSVLDQFGGLGGLPDNLSNLFRPPYQQDGARVHTNSWGSVGSEVGGLYNQNAREVDEFVWNNRDYVICFSAGNEGQDANANGQVDAMSITPPATAKNCITIGASENDRSDFTLTYGQGWPSDFPADPIASDNVSSNPDGMVGFSGRGPTRDQRIKPDIVAPGTFILSTRSRATQDRGWALSDDDLFYFMGGTSMATPLVAGCAALVREFLIKQKGLQRPSAALVKAMLINGARDIAGQYLPSEAGSIPNAAEGFGRVDMRATVGPFAANETFTIKDESTTLDTAEQESLTVDVPPNARLLKVTLVWTDPAGENLQNDLDLIVRLADGKERHGNVPAGSTAFDRNNNVEQVMVANPPGGQTEVIVHAHRVAKFAQPYALVVRVA
jgi:subtilisin family serine protease